MKDKYYEEYVKSEEWQERREEILQRDNHKCQICGKSEGVMCVHHICYKHPYSDTPDKDLITLCSDCHAKVHEVQKRMNGFAAMEMKKIRETWGAKMADAINEVFPQGVGKNRNKTLSIMRFTFYYQRPALWTVMPDFEELQRKVRRVKSNV